MHTADWLTPMLEEGRDRWCTRPFCTTCGGMDFRRVVWSEAARRSGVWLTRTDIRAGINALPPDDTRAVGLELAEALRQVPEQGADREAMHTLLIDLQRVLFARAPLDTLLGDSWAAQLLRDMETHARELVRYRAEVAVRRRDEQAERKQRQAERAARHVQRLRDKQGRDAWLAGVLAELARLPIEQRLERIAVDATVPLGAVAGLLPSGTELERVQLSPQVSGQLIQRIDRRGGAWRRLRRSLK